MDLVAREVDGALGPDKLNYEIHGNTIPHLHLHLFPRRLGDRFEGVPINGREAIARTEADLAALRTALAPLQAKASDPAVSRLSSPHRPLLHRRDLHVLGQRQIQPVSLRLAG